MSPDSGLAWAEEGAWRVADGVHRIPLPLPMDGLRAVNVYAIEHAGGLTLIDGGWAIEASRSSLLRGLASIGATVRDIDQFLVTHVHRDHYTQASVLGRELGIPVSLGSGERPTIDHIHEGTSSLPFVRALREAGADELAAEWERLHEDGGHLLHQFGYPTSWLTDDQNLPVGDRVLRAVHTPGHTPGHVVFADIEARLLFAGDHVLPTITPSLGFVAPVPVDPLGSFMASLTKVRALPDLTLLPAHGPVAASSHARADELLEHHEARLSQTIETLGAGPRTPADVAEQLTWTRRERRFAQLDTFNQGIAVLETKAHLDVLVARGLVVTTWHDGTQVCRLATARDDG